MAASTKSSYCLLLTLVVAASLAMTVTARPRDGFPQNSFKDKYCEVNELQQEICQKCAKITKSKYVYPMCCNEEEGVFKWCTDYVNFGFTPDAPRPPGSST